MSPSELHEHRIKHEQMQSKRRKQRQQPYTTDGLKGTSFIMNDIEEFFTYFKKRKETIEKLNSDVSPTPIWVDIENASDEIVHSIGTLFQLHALTIEDCYSNGIREKLEVFNDYLFLVFHALDHLYHEASTRTLGYEVMTTTPLKLIVFTHCVVAFHKGQLSAVENVRQQLAKVTIIYIEHLSFIIFIICSI
jgi:Mg2+ and Co2+ transporter CorA